MSEPIAPIRSALPPEDPDAQKNIARSRLTDTARGIDALHGLMRIRNSQDHRKHPGMTEEQLAQRKTLMDIAIRVLEAELDKDLDAAAMTWLRARRLIE